jgi:hypothetical protein
VHFKFPANRKSESPPDVTGYRIPRIRLHC